MKENEGKNQIIKILGLSTGHSYQRPPGLGALVTVLVFNSWPGRALASWNAHYITRAGSWTTHLCEAFSGHHVVGKVVGGSSSRRMW